MIESAFIKILNKNQKNMIIGCVYKDPKHEVSDFMNNYIASLLDKLSNEKKDRMIMGDFNINLKSNSHIPKKFFFCFNDSPSKTMKNPFISS